MNYEVIHIRTVETEGEGALSFFETGVDLPFEIKRSYYIYGTKKNVIRGGHAHKKLKQLLYCPYGKINILLDDGTKRKEVLLDSPDKGLILYPGIWRDMEWEVDNSVLCVAASELYDENDYIRDKDEYVKWKRGNMDDIIS